MLTLLLPNQVMENWAVIKDSVERALRPDIVVDENLLTNIQMALLKGNAQAWLLYKSNMKAGTSDMKAIALTTITEDFVSGFRSLLIYSLTGNFVKDSKNSSLDLWLTGLNGLKKYAAKEGCSSISFYTSKKGAMLLSQSFGANIDNIFGYIGVDHEDL